MAKKTRFHPAELLLELIFKEGWTLEETGSNMGVGGSDLLEILCQRQPVDEFVTEIAEATQTTPDLWLKLQSQYNEGN